MSPEVLQKDIYHFHFQFNLGNADSNFYDSDFFIVFALVSTAPSEANFQSDSQAEN